MFRPAANPWLHRFALLTAGATLALVGIGGLVTSHEAGMAVPDWPNSYGYNMFLFPVSKWMGGIFYEHSHRLAASLVGLLTTILCLWVWVRETKRPESRERRVSSSNSSKGPSAGAIGLKTRMRSFLAGARETQSLERWLGIGLIASIILVMGIRKLPVFIALAAAAPIAIIFSSIQIRRHPSSLRWWGVIAFAAVILQGVLGGLRVVLYKDEIGIFHAVLAQLFLVLLWVIALFSSQWWRNGGSLPGSVAATSRLRQVLLLASVLIFAQLALGATMRHQHAGLAIPDFPLAYGKLWPALDVQSITSYNQQRKELTAVNSITAFQIELQMAHRLLALLIVCAVCASAWMARKQLGSKHPLSKLTLIWVGLICVQAILGASTIWSNKAADIATLHVVVGALSLAGGSLLATVSWLRLKVVGSTVKQPAKEMAFGSGKAATAHSNP